MMNENEYVTALRKNADLYTHPDFLNSDRPHSRDFILQKQECLTDIQSTETSPNFCFDTNSNQTETQTKDVEYSPMKK